MAQINRGSEWRKWDLHVHTPASFYWNGTKKYKEMSREEVVTEIKKFIEIVNKSDIAVFCLMDYWTFDWYLELQEYLISNPDELKKTVLPGMELRVESPTNYRLNVHFILSDKLTKQQLIDFKSELYIRSINKKLSDDSLIQFAKSLDVSKAKHHSFDDPNVLSEEQLLQLGSQTAEITKESLHEAFKQIPETSGFVFLPYDTSDGLLKLNWKNHPHADNYFMQTADIFESRDQTNIDLICGKLTEENSPFFENFYKTLGNKSKPCVAGSDAHKYSDYGKFPSNKATWIKAQPTFEGLKQIIYEPEERVKIQKEMPEAEKLDNLMIEKVTFTSSKNRFTPEPIYFNKNLNVIIGGKSSGKSILLYNIAKTLYENQNDSILKYKDANDNKEKDLYDLSIDDPQFNFTVENFLGISQSIKRENGKNSILGSIKYIPQNHLSDLVDKSLRNSNELKKYIRNLLREDSKYNKIYEDFIEKLGHNDEIRKNDISQYFIYKEELRKKKEELQHKGDKESIIKNIEALESKIAETKKDLTSEQTNEYNSLTNEYSELEKIKNSLIGDFEKIFNFYESTKYALNELKEKKTLLIENIELEDIKNDYTVKLNFIDDAISENENIKKLITKDENDNFQISDNNILSFKLSGINKRLNELDKNLASLNSLFENQNLITGYQKTISEEKIKIAEIEQIEKETENISKTASDRKIKIFEDIRGNRKLYDNLLVDFGSRIDKIKEEDPELKIEGKIYFNFPKYREIILDFSHGNTKSYSDYKIFDENNKALTEYDFEKYLDDLKSVFENIENGDYRLRNNTSKQEAIIKILEQKHFFDHWDITYKNDTIHKMSTGKASLVLLKVMIKLSEIKGPILIDQPEDNLDNRSVTNELIEYLKEKKKERQIILVTHNANIVVNADAENIIIANQRGQSDDDELGSPYLFDYINGALEDINPISANQNEKDLLKSMGIREHITQIVEGGKEAFKKREEKYGFI